MRHTKKQKAPKPDCSLRCQEQLAKAIARVKGADSDAARALQELERQRGDAACDSEIIIFPLAGKWLVGPEHELRQMVDRQVQAQLERVERMRRGQTKQPRDKSL